MQKFSNLFGGHWGPEQHQVEQKFLDYYQKEDNEEEYDNNWILGWSKPCPAWALFNWPQL